GIMNPGSDVDLLFLTSVPSSKVSKRVSEIICELQNTVWDLGFKFLPSTRSSTECLNEARLEPQSRTALFDARLLIGPQDLFQKFQDRFRKVCIEKDKEAFFDERRSDITSRHAKWSHTVFLQEPNIKDSPGTLRDYHNLEWIIDAEAGTRSMTELVSRRILSRLARRELKDAFNFLHRVRNALHYHDKGNDILTLRFQGIVANEFGYPQKSILRRIECFMKDYYTHARNVYNHTKSVFEIFELQHDEGQQYGLRSKLTFGLIKKKIKSLDDYTIRDKRLFPRRKTIFEENPNRLIRLFAYCQKYELSPSPSLRKLIKTSWLLIDKSFRMRVMWGANDILRPGLTPSEYQKQVLEIMEKELIDLGLIDAEEAKKQDKSKKLVKKYFMHGTSHHLGLDVHDVFPANAPYAVGQVLTIEPGIYIPEENLGVRIENDIMIGEADNIDMFANFPTTVEEIEAAMAE
ncbi:M24 family metallopeptidase, partial [bacterium]|nr:M24 family metallopeptidase [bacterium]